MTRKQTKTAKYALSLKIGDRVYQSSGMSPIEALDALERPPKIMAKAVLTVTNGNLKKELLLQPLKIKRLFFNSGGVQAVIAKQLFAFMK